jgi:hypothetical protein
MFFREQYQEAQMKSSKKISKVAGVDGTAILILEKEGLWTVSATLDGETKSTEVLVEHNVEESLFFFPEEPSSYEQIVLITSSQTWEVPENGYFQIEVFGASGNGGNGVGHEPLHVWLASGGGGGGGGYSCSRVKLKKGETVELTVGSVGATSYAKINSSVETYNTISVTSGANGGNATIAGNGLYDYHPGGGGAGGIATGGNYANKNGGYGGTGYRDEEYDCRGGDGGAAGYTGGRVGGVGGEGGAAILTIGAHRSQQTHQRLLCQILVRQSVTADAADLVVDKGHHTMHQQGKRLLIACGGLCDG